ncbi:SIMPL domain-containing protein [Candidatus Nomurabacteria bacterium]|nr:SIMPL domain-containing protein [Candidatus Nomurabacteria bacterium]
MENEQKVYQPHRLWVKITMMVLITIVLVVALLRDRIINDPQYQVSVTGRGEVSYLPDTAKIDLGVQVDRAANANLALENLNQKMNQVLQAIKDQGIEEKDIQTRNYNLYPQYDYFEGSSKLAGYSANQSVIITVNNFSAQENIVGNLISAATKAGANQVNSVNFEAADLENLKQEARLKAITDAKMKAKEMSKATGVRLGKTIGWWENYYPANDVYGKGGAMLSAEAAPAYLPSGEYDLVVEVNLNYKVK